MSIQTFQELKWKEGDWKYSALWCNIQTAHFFKNVVLIPGRYSKEVILEACKIISDFYTAGGNEQQ